MITCNTYWLSLALVVCFTDGTYISLSPDEQREFAISCGQDPDDDDLLEIEECPGWWGCRKQLDREVG